MVGSKYSPDNRRCDLVDYDMRKGIVVQFGLERRPVTPEVASSSLVDPANFTIGPVTQR